jgi:hypothetical protein
MDNISKAFERGYVKRAHELGFTKEAFLPLAGLAAGTALRFGGQLLGSVALPGIVGRLALRGGRIGSRAKQLHNVMNMPGTKGMVANMGLMQVGGMAGDTVTSPIANRLEGVA